ncbi:ATP-binding protein, partial [Nocardioides hankookensis]
MSRVMGRLGLLSEVQDLLAQGESVALHGPTGIGKSALLDALEEQRRERPDALVLRANGAVAEHGLPYAALQDLVDQQPVELGGSLPLMAAPVEEDRLRTVLCTSFRSLLEQASRTRTVLILLDDVQWLDPQSACVIGYGRRRLTDRVSVVATVGPARDPLA